MAYDLHHCMPTNRDAGWGLPVPESQGSPIYTIRGFPNRYVNPLTPRESHVYCHRAKDEPSWFGGVLLEIIPDDDERSTCKIQSTHDARGRPWRGRDDPRL
jgi:hypothetical protein